MSDYRKKEEEKPNPLPSRAKPEEIQQQRVQIVAPITNELLKFVGENRYEGSQNIAYRQDDTLNIETLEHQHLMGARWDDTSRNWYNINSNLSDEDVSHFQSIQAVIIQRIEELERNKQQQEFVGRLAPLIADYHDLVSFERGQRAARTRDLAVSVESANLRPGGNRREQSSQESEVRKREGRGQRVVELEGDLNCSTRSTAGKQFQIQRTSDPSLSTSSLNEVGGLDDKNKLKEKTFCHLPSAICLQGQSPVIGYYSTSWDTKQQVLTLIDEEKSEEILTAQLTDNGWKNIDSQLSSWQVDELENEIMSTLDCCTEELQAKRFKAIQPVVAEVLRHNKTNHLEGSQHGARWDKSSQTLTAWKKGDSEPFLSARWSGDSGWKDTGENVISFETAHHFQEQILPKLERHSAQYKTTEIHH
ncbi:MAG: hypothetical protein VKK42_20180 [Lyngbya sp.]|nr:hypothetical protein [Lyngbya sp.]